METAADDGPLPLDGEDRGDDLDALADVKDAGARLADVAGAHGGTVTLSGAGVSARLTGEDGPRLRKEAADLRRQART